MLHLVEDLDRVMAEYKASYQIGTKSTTSEARKNERAEKGGVTLEEDFEPDISGFPQLETVDCEILLARDLCRANCFA